MEEALRFFSSVLAPAARQRGDESSLHMAEQTRDRALGEAEEQYFSQALRAEVEARLTPGARVLLLDLGGPPLFAPRLVRSLVPALGLLHAGAALVRLDPNPAGHAVARAAFAALQREAKGIALHSSHLSVDPAGANVGPAAWSIVRRSFSLVITVAPGGRLHVADEGFGDHAPRSLVRNFCLPADLSLVTLLNPARLDRMVARLLALKERGALFHELRLRPVTRMENGSLLLGDERSLPLAPLPDPTGANHWEPSLAPSFWMFGVAQAEGPTLPLALLFSEPYLKEQLLAGFSRTPATAVGEGLITTLRYVN